MPNYATGPSRHSSGPIPAVYAEWDAIGRPCTNCGAAVNAWCVRSDGTHKPVPCWTRQRPSAPEAATHPKTHQNGTQPQQSLSGDDV